MIKTINRRILILLLLVLVVGVTSMWWEAQSTDKVMREAFLEQARIAAQAINIQRVVSLSGYRPMGYVDYCRGPTHRSTD